MPGTPQYFLTFRPLLTPSFVTDKKDIHKVFGNCSSTAGLRPRFSYPALESCLRYTIYSSPVCLCSPSSELPVCYRRTLPQFGVLEDIKGLGMQLDERAQT